MGRLLVLLCLIMLQPACSQDTPADRSAFAEQLLAHHVGVVAYLYGYPMVDMYRRMHNETHRVSPDQSFYAPANSLSAVDNLTWAGWLDLRNGGARLILAAEPGAEFVVTFTAFGVEPVHLPQAIPDDRQAALTFYTGDDPGDSDLRLYSRTPFAYLVVKSHAALAADAVSLHAESPRPAAPDLRVAPLEPMHSLGFFEVLNLLLKETTPSQEDRELLRQFDSIGVGPNAEFSQAGLSPSRKRGLERAIRDARAMLESVGKDYDGDDLLARAVNYNTTINDRRPGR